MDIRDPNYMREKRVQVFYKKYYMESPPRDVARSLSGVGASSVQRDSTS